MLPENSQEEVVGDGWRLTVVALVAVGGSWQRLVDWANVMGR
jgi:hypothetical protein